MLAHSYQSSFVAPLAASPMEQFVIFPVFPSALAWIPSLNSVALYLIFASMITLVLIALPSLAKEGTPIVSSWWGILSESLYRTLLSMVETYVGPASSVARDWFPPMIFTIFHLILFSNLLGMVPYSTTSTVEII